MPPVLRPGSSLPALPPSLPLFFLTRIHYRMYARCMDVALIVVIAGVIAGGVLGGVLRGWSIGARLHTLDVRVTGLEGQVLKLVKSNAAGERWGKRDKATDDAKELLAAAGKVQTPQNGEGVRWW